MNLTLAGWGLGLFFLAALAFPRPGHPLHHFFNRNKSKSMLREMVDVNVAAAAFEESPKFYHSGWSRLDLVTGETDDPSSWIGGLPEMPADTVWPEEDGKAAMFLAQIAMSDLPKDIWGGLGPKTGWLLFFLAPGNWGGVRVLHTRERGAPRCYPNGACVANFLSMSQRDVMKHLGRPEDAFIPPRWALAISPTNEQLPNLFAKIAERDALLKTYREIDLGDPRLAPYTTGENSSHGTVEYLARLTYAQNPSALAPETRAIFEERWTLEARSEAAIMGGPVGAEFFYAAPEEPVVLLRLRSSQLLGWSFGDVKDLGIFISADDLKSRRWDKAWFDYTG